MKRLLQRPASRFLPSCPGFLPRVWVPSPGRQGKVPDLKDLLLRHAHDRLIPAVSINQMKIYAPCSTSTTLLTGSGHDLQLISRVVPCSLKHLDTSCSLQHIDRYMPSSTRSNKETQLLFSPDPASLERSIRKKARSSSTDNNTCASLDFAQPPSTQTLVPSTQTLVPSTDTRSPLSTDTRSPLSTDTRSPLSTDTRSPLSTEDTHLPSTDIIHPTSIDTPSQTSIDTEPRDMVATLILVRENNGDMHDHEGHLLKKPQTISRRINDPGIIATCHCGAKYESDYSASIDTHPVKSIDNTHRKSTDTHKEELVDTYPDEWENDYNNPTTAAYTKQNMHTDEYDEDYEEERATEYIAILDEEEKLLHHSSWKRNAPSIDMKRSPSIDTQPHQRNRKRTSTNTAYYKSIDTEVNHAREGDYLIGSWANEHHHESFAIRAATAWERTRFSHPIDREIRPSIDTRRPQSINIYNTTDPDGYAKAIDGRTLYVSREDIADILQTANGADNLFVHHNNNPEQKATKEFYDTTGGIDKRFRQRSCHTTQQSIDVNVPTSVDRRPKFGRRAFDFYGTRKFYWEEKDEYGVYGDDQRYTRDLDGHTIHVHNKDIRRFLERASRDELAYICLPEHASSFTQTKLVP
ncbi:hypothetical protein DY000_02008196 [Brassica cretica]|uniref:Uncharacterized protein n=1 Tax=Brassica cretica TaxID=69181 RepID=A0ABQ7CIT8_BRACR|nr:hypothetical protein DY000_02008196 [Brassica cretica]